MRRIIAQSADDLGLSFKFMPSGAGHDAQDIVLITPTGMIFVPSVKGVSHSPKEFTSAEDMANGASVLLRTVLEIDGGGLDWIQRVVELRMQEELFVGFQRFALRAAD